MSVDSVEALLCPPSGKDELAAYLADLRVLLRVKSDADLARDFYLVPAPTLAAWRTRGSVGRWNQRHACDFVVRSCFRRWAEDLPQVSRLARAAALEHWSLSETSTESGAAALGAHMALAEFLAARLGLNRSSCRAEQITRLCHTLSAALAAGARGE